ncbi:hypothetical protein CIT292_06753 [Citrobacter youngae ATCC 29220]|uniref:Uncharacterized protein n=1 Tax=Citrobacter youngae ATCC 29220 TaxID=500640 RepID=D4B6B6_9ENTR|nr:hypothetical protein CIT292_06753 [Citrobacter youngae ATCC 29220]
MITIVLLTAKRFSSFFCALSSFFHYFSAKSEGGSHFYACDILCITKHKK